MCYEFIHINTLFIYLHRYGMNYELCWLNRAEHHATLEDSYLKRIQCDNNAFVLNISPGHE
jgi:hypothetical protein